MSAYWLASQGHDNVGLVAKHGRREHEMKFGLMYEIGMPKPWYEGQEREKYWQVMAQIQYAEEMGFDYTWA